MDTTRIHNIIKWGLVLGFFLIPFNDFAQAVPPPIPPPPPPGLPIDGGISFLIIVATLLGVRKYKDSSS